MRTFATLIISLSAAWAAAQESTNPNAFNIPSGQSSYVVTAGQTLDLSWSNQSGSTVTIKLQQSGQITPDSGVTLADKIPNTGSTTVTIPSGSDIPNSGSYTLEIIDDSGSAEPNFAPNFSVAGASGTAGFGASATASGTASASASASASATTTGTETTTGSSASATSNSTVTSTTSTRTTSTRSSAAATSSAAETTSAPNSNAGAKVHAPLAAAIMLGAAAFF